MKEKKKETITTKTIVNLFQDRTPSKTIEINIPDATSATNYQNKVLRTQLGAYDKATNSCVDHVNEVLRKGGIDVQRSPLGQYKYLKSIGF